MLQQQVLQPGDPGPQQLNHHKPQGLPKVEKPEEAGHDEQPFESGTGELEGLRELDPDHPLTQQDQRARRPRAPGQPQALDTPRGEFFTPFLRFHASSSSWDWATSCHRRLVTGPRCSP